MLKKPMSLTLRLFLCVAALNILTMVVIGLLALRSMKINIGEVADAQLITEASTLWEILEEDSKDGKIDAFRPDGFDMEKSGEFMEREDQDSMLDYAQYRAFLVWKDAHIVMHSDNTKAFPLKPLPAGFSNIMVDGSEWRAFSLIDPANNLVVATFENLNDRDILKLDIFLDILTPLVITLPILALIFSFGVGIGLRDLHALTKRIASRSFSDLSSLDAGDLPKELKPLTKALNHLLSTLKASLTHEREFIDHAAHELRTPLSALKLQTQLLTKSIKDPQTMQQLDELHASVNRTARLVDQLLLLSRVSQQEILFEKVSLGDVIKEIISHYAVRIADKNIALTLNAQGPLPLHSQSDLLHTLIGTILDNAIKYTPKDGDIIIDASQSNGITKVTITDSGEGIPEYEREKVFDRFYRLPATKQSGSGLGLAIAKQIATMLGADISLETPKNTKGLSVLITFS